jgi:hypothetical protein
MDTDLGFEREVRRIARLLWPAAEGAGALMIAGREHDGVFETEECVHFVESTTSRAEKKAVEDCLKMTAAAEASRKQRPEKAVKCWFITREDPTADLLVTGCNKRIDGVGMFDDPCKFALYPPKATEQRLHDFVRSEGRFLFAVRRHLRGQTTIHRSHRLQVQCGKNPFCRVESTSFY